MLTVAIVITVVVVLVALFYQSLLLAEKVEKAAGRTYWIADRRPLLEFDFHYPHYKKLKDNKCHICKRTSYTTITVLNDPIIHALCHCRGCNYKWTADVEGEHFSTALHKRILSMENTIMGLAKDKKVLERENKELKRVVAIYEKPVYKESDNFRVAPDAVSSAKKQETDLPEQFFATVIKRG